MRITTFRLLECSLLIASVACGGGGSSSPSAPAPTPIPVANFAGTWSGTYVLTSCGHTGDFASTNFCGTFTIGLFLPMTLSLAQSGSSVTGTLLQGSILTTVSGSVDSAGHLVLAGTGAVSGFALQMVGWDTTQSGGRMSGSWNTRWTGGGPSHGATSVGRGIRGGVGEDALGYVTLLRGSGYGPRVVRPTGRPVH
jgi:hypothetical protein